MSAVMAGAVLTGCHDDDLYLTPGSDQANYRPDVASLVFDIDLAPFGDGNDNNNFSKEPDHGEAWENYIDPAKFRVIFCDMDGNYLFETNRRNISIISKDQHWSGVSGSDHNSAYRVFITREELEHVLCADPDCFRDPERAERHKVAIQEAIFGKKDETTGKYEGAGFKVAVLANWPAFVEGKRERDSYTGDELLGPDDVSTDLDFKWHDGKLLGWEEEARARNTKIGYLSQCIFDNVYGQPDYADEDGSNPVFAEPYEHIVYKSNKDNVGKMGVFTSWVSYLFHSQRDTENFIRTGLDQTGGDIEGIVHFTYSYDFENGRTDDKEAFRYTPYSYTRSVDADNVYSLENIWRLFNFSAGATCPLYTLSDKAKDYWHMRNDNVLIRELDKVNWESGSGFIIKDHSGDLLIESNNPKTTYVPVTGTSGGYLSVPDNGVKTANINKMAPGISDKNGNTTDADNFRDNAIHFRAYGEGQLRIRARAGGQGKISVLTKTPTRGAQKLVPVYNGDKSGDGYIFVPGQSANTRDGYPEVEFLIDPSSEEYLDVYIAAVDGTVQFYEIEYMRARHIYDSARNALMPSKTHSIPMYGIQNFDVIGDYVEALPPNETFNLSDRDYNTYLKTLSLDPYNYKDIFLLRSLAKVELRFKRSVFEKHMPEHVMMRVMNRTARCEPRDVVNPTEWIWYGSEGIWETNGHLGTPNPIDPEAGTIVGADKEFENIMNYYKDKPLYDTSVKSDVMMQEYRNRTAWFYGFWSIDGLSKYYWQVPWSWNGMNPEVDQTYPFPRIFNTRIDRSDYCRFHHVPDKDGYIRYIMYVPEKNITDTDSKGQLSATPKVEHIEIRFHNMNDVMNFDDDDCYRIYFTNYAENGKRMKEVNRNGGYTDFEKDRDVLNTLQPIMRNCHYIFTINSINDEEIGVGYSVCNAASRNANIVIN